MCIHVVYSSSARRTPFCRWSRGGLGLDIVPASAIGLSYPDIVSKAIWRDDIVPQKHLLWHADDHKPTVATMADFVIRHSSSVGASKDALSAT
jgi:hypothetical protein